MYFLLGSIRIWPSRQQVDESMPETLKINIPKYMMHNLLYRTLMSKTLIRHCSKFPLFKLTLPVPIPDYEKKLRKIFIFALFCGASKGFNTFLPYLSFLNFLPGFKVFTIIGKLGMFPLFFLCISISLLWIKVYSSTILFILTFHFLRCSYQYFLQCYLLELEACVQCFQLFYFIR